MAGPIVGPILPPEKQERINATESQLVRDALREALQSKLANQEQSSVPVQPWIAPAHVAADMRQLGSDTRAGFRPSTDGERTIAIRLLERLNPDPNGSHGVDAYLARQHRFIKTGKYESKSNLSEIERQALADAGVRKEIASYGRYARDHAQKLTSIRALSAILETRSDTEKVGDILTQLADGGIKQGSLALIQHRALGEVAARGISSMGVSPFRNLGINFDEIAAQLGTANGDGRNKKDQALRYAQDRLAEMTTADAKKIALAAARFQWNGVSFWSNVLESIRGHYGPIAKEALESVWKP